VQEILREMKHSVTHCYNLINVNPYSVCYNLFEIELHTDNYIFYNQGKTMNTNVLNFVNHNVHPLDQLEAPDIVNTVIEARPMLYTNSSGFHATDPTRRGLHIVGTNEPPINVVKPSYNFKGAQYGDLYNAMVNICKAAGINCKGATVSHQMSADGALGSITITLPEYTIETAKGDASVFQITGRTSFNGVWAVVLQIGAVRMLCVNGQVFIDNFSMYKAKHTISMSTEHAQRKLAAALNSYQHEAERWKHWTQNSITNREAFNVFAVAAKCRFVLGNPQLSVTELMAEPEVYRNRALQYMWNQYTTDEQKVLGSTHWAAYNAMTHWSTHAPAAKKTAEGNILAIKAKRTDLVRAASKCLAA